MQVPNLENDIKAAVIGTLGSGLSGLLLLPLTREFVKRQIDLNRTTINFMQDAFDRGSALRLYKFSGKAVIHAVARSFTSLGVGNLVLQRMQQEESSAKKGLIAGLCAGASQAVLTTSFSHSIISSLSNQPQLSFWSLLANRKIFFRVYIVALLKNSLDQGIALMISQLCKKILLEEKILKSVHAVSFVSGVAGAGFATLVCMPLVSAETHVLATPKEPLSTWANKMLLKENPRLLWRGAGIRVIRASLGLGIGLLATDWMNSRLF